MTELKKNSLATTASATPQNKALKQEHYCNKKNVLILLQKVDRTSTLCNTLQQLAKHFFVARQVVRGM